MIEVLKYFFTLTKAISWMATFTFTRVNMYWRTASLSFGKPVITFWKIIESWDTLVLDEQMNIQTHTFTYTGKTLLSSTFDDEQIIVIFI